MCAASIRLFRFQIPWGADRGPLHDEDSHRDTAVRLLHDTCRKHVRTHAPLLEVSDPRGFCACVWGWRPTRGQQLGPQAGPPALPAPARAPALGGCRSSGSGLRVGFGLSIWCDLRPERAVSADGCGSRAQGEETRSSGGASCGEGASRSCAGLDPHPRPPAQGCCWRERPTARGASPSSVGRRERKQCLQDATVTQPKVTEPRRGQRHCAECEKRRFPPHPVLPTPTAEDGLPGGHAGGFPSPPGLPGSGLLPPWSPSPRPRVPARAKRVRRPKAEARRPQPCVGTAQRGPAAGAGAEGAEVQGGPEPATWSEGVETGRCLRVHREPARADATSRQPSPRAGRSGGGNHAALARKGCGRLERDSGSRWGVSSVRARGGSAPGDRPARPLQKHPGRGRGRGMRPHTAPPFSSDSGEPGNQPPGA